MISRSISAEQSVVWLLLRKTRQHTWFSNSECLDYGKIRGPLIRGFEKYGKTCGSLVRGLRQYSKLRGSLWGLRKHCKIRGSLN